MSDWELQCIEAEEECLRLKARIELLEGVLCDADGDFSYGELALENQANIKRIEALETTTTEQAAYIKFLEDEWVNPENHRDAKEAYAALKQEAV